MNNHFNLKFNVVFLQLVEGHILHGILHSHKIHKQDTSLKLIVSAIDSPAHKLAKNAAQQLQIWCNTTSTHVEDLKRDILTTLTIQKMSFKDLLYF